MFAVEEVTVDARYDRAVARLVHLINHGTLHGISEAAYELVRVGPFGDAPGLSKLVRVRVLEPVRHGDAMTAPLRWEATGPAGGLFPVLDADLVLMPDGDEGCRLRLIGSYRPPWGIAGAVLDRAIMGRIATATIRSLLDSIAPMLAEVIPSPQSGTDAVRWRYDP
jgi:hypothetical protein